MFFSAIADMTGWPPKVIPCEYIEAPSRNGSITLSVASTAPIAAYDGREPLGAADDVRPDVVALGGEPVADAAERGDHLVGGEQDVVAVAELADAAPVARRRREGAARVLHRLHVDEADRLRPHREDRLLEVLEQHRRELRLGLLGRPVVAVRVLHVPHLGHERLERLLQRRDAVDRERSHRRPVVGDLARDRLVLARHRRAGALVAPRLAGRNLLAAAREVVLARELPRRLDRLRAAGDEEHAVQVAGRERRDLRGQLDRARVRVRPVRVEGQLAHLLERRLADLLAEAVAEVDREEARRARRGSACRSSPRGSSRRRGR